MKNNNTKMKTKSDMKILSETNTSRSVNNPTPHIDMNEDQSEFPNDDEYFHNEYYILKFNIFISQIYHINQIFDRMKSVALWSANKKKKDHKRL
jgi:hypothetical protein